MRVLYISHLHPPADKPLKNVGGMQSVSLQFLNNIHHKKDVELETLIMHASWRFIGVKTTFFLLSLLYKIPSKIKSFNPDVILFSSMVTASVSPFLSKKIDVPLVTINHGQDVTLPVSLYQRYLPKVFNRLSGVISVSSATREASIQRGLHPQKGVALPNGFDALVEKDLPKKVQATRIVEEEYGVNLKHKKLILTVGRQVKRKGHSWFIDNVLDKIKSDFVFVLVGFGPEYETIKEARERSPLKQNIILAGKISEEMLNACYSAADLFVMPNIPVEGDMEGFGIVLLEANRAGVPAISSDLEGMKDVIENGENGYKVPVKNAQLFAEKIDKVLNNDLNKLSKSAKKYVMENFNWETVINRYITFLEQTINRNN